MDELLLLWNDWWLIQFCKTGSNIVYTNWYRNYARLEDKLIELENNPKMKVIRWHAVVKNGSRKRRE